MRLRATVTQLWHDSSEEDEDAVSADAVWQPGSPEGSDAEDAGRADMPAPAAARDPAPRRLSHADLTRALLDMPAAHDTPAVAAPEALTQVRRPLARCLRGRCLVFSHTRLRTALVTPALRSGRLAAASARPRW
jgi:hypothetical protein